MSTTVENPKVTIVMPVFNGGRYFQIALESALAQTYENLEIVVVNDGSTDGGETESIALRYGSRIRYIRQENRGVGGALNAGIREMTGDFFAWLSYENIYLPHKAASQIAFFRRLSKPEAILFSDYEMIDFDGKVISVFKLPHRDFVAKPSLPLMNACIKGCTLLIPTSIIKRFGEFNESLPYTQDYDLWNKILPKHAFFHQPAILVQTRLHPGQYSNKPAAAAEGDALWIRMLNTRTRIEQAQMFGSRQRYFTSVGRFLEKTPYQAAARYAGEQAGASLTKAFISVVMPVWNDAGKAARGIRNLLAQTHQNFELLVIDDGSTEDMSEITAVSASDRRVRLFRQSNRGPADARNFGLSEAQGEYIAFLDADDCFIPQKLQRQVGLMQQSGALFSHTSYFVEFPECLAGLGVYRSGKLNGSVYPEILRSCPIATPTVMLHRLLVAEGFRFPWSLQVAEDVLMWIDIAARCEVLGIDEPLTVVEWSSSCTALDVPKSLHGLSNLVWTLREHPLHGRNKQQIADLIAAFNATARRWEVDPVAEKKAKIDKMLFAFGEIANTSKNYTPLVSIIIPVYNGANYLEHAINSALDQTYPNCEIIVVNDGSTDEGATERIALTYGDRIRYIWKENGKTASALNCGIAHMQGKYFSWLSHDDLYNKRKIAEQVKLAEDHGGEAVIVCNVAKIDSLGNRIRTNRISDHFSRSVRCYLALDVATGINGCALLIPKKLLDEVGPFRLDQRIAQDYFMWFQMAEKAEFVLLDEELVLSRIHPDQDSRRLTDIVLDECDDLHSGFLRQISEQEIKKFIGYDIAYLVNSIYIYYISGYKKTAWEIIKHAKNVHGLFKAMEVHGKLYSIVFGDELDNFLEKTAPSLYQVDDMLAKRKPRVLVYSNVWVKGGLERVVSTIIPYLYEHFTIFLVHRRNPPDIDITGSFPLPKDVLEIILPNSIGPEQFPKD